MAKILLVEDDNNLREIYEARLQAEGYEIATAPDGETALVVAKKELPDIVISDVMMPRISGFEMLDIMRNTEGLKHVRVIMLTALGQAEDKARADSLGADKYLVKSQVTLEDIVKAAAELMGEETPAPSTPSTAAAAAEFAPPAATTPPATMSPTPTVPTVPSVAPAVAPAPTPPPQAAPSFAAPAAVPVAPLTTPAVVPTPTPEPAPAAPANPSFTPYNPAPAPAPVAPTPASVTPPPDLAATPSLAPVPTVPPPTPTPLTPAPPAAPPAATPAAAAPATDQLVANAVQDLINGTPEAQQTQPAPAPTPEPTPTPTLSPTTEPAPVPTPAASTESNTNDDDEDTRTKKVIQPLGSNNNAPTPPNLDELMVKEGHALDATAPHDDTMPHQPGLVISPAPANDTNPPGDHGKIAL